MRFLCILLIVLDLWSSSLATDNEILVNSTLANNSKVGESLADIPEPYIVGGRIASPNEFPWLVHLIIDEKSFCGGALIEPDLVLTAGHCLIGSNTPASSVLITAGDHDLTKQESTEQTAWASGVKIHENYQVIEPSKILKNDIALVKLSKNFTLTKFVKTINYIPRNLTQATSGTVAGWGTVHFGGSMSDVLLKVDVPIVPNSNNICSRLLSDSNSQFCAGVQGKDACQGDSGGPFLCNTASDVVCGIVSYGEGCAENNKPGVYTKVASYTSWIQKNLKGTFSSRLPNSSPAFVCISLKLYLVVAALTVSPIYLRFF